MRNGGQNERNFDVIYRIANMFEHEHFTRAPAGVPNHLERRLRSAYFIILNIDQPNILLIICQLRSIICYG